MASSKSLVALSLALVASFVLCTAEGGFSSGLGSVVDRLVTGHVEEPEWDYSDGPEGPAHWGELSPKWEACSKGSAQSPIDVNDDNIQQNSGLDVPATVYFRTGNASISSDGKVLEATWDGGAYIVYNTVYRLNKLVFHSPSEHTYNNKSFPLEIQFYYSNPTEGIAINSLVFELGKFNAWLWQFTSPYNVRRNLGERIDLGKVSPVGVQAKDLDWSRYYRYLGSLTTPPCSESPSVIWSLFKSPLTASYQQIETIAASALQYEPNARPIQPIGDRKIYYPTNVDDSN